MTTKYLLAGYDGGEGNNRILGPMFDNEAECKKAADSLNGKGHSYDWYSNPISSPSDRARTLIDAGMCMWRVQIENGKSVGASILDFETVECVSSITGGETGWIDLPALSEEQAMKVAKKRWLVMYPRKASATSPRAELWGMIRETAVLMETGSGMLEVNTRLQTMLETEFISMAAPNNKRHCIGLLSDEAEVLADSLDKEGNGVTAASVRRMAVILHVASWLRPQDDMEQED